MENINNSETIQTKETINAQVEAFQESILAAAELYVDKRLRDDKEHKRSPELESLFTQRQIAKDEGWYEMTKPYTQKIRRLLKKERLDKNIQDLEKGLWYDIKKAKAKFLPSHTKLRKADGTVCASNERPDILADHFEHKQWGIDETRERDTPKANIPRCMSSSGRTYIKEAATVVTGYITIEEIRISIRKMKNNRSPGPDGIPVGFFKLLDDDGLELIRNILNNCWENEIMPDEMELAELVTLYKKGNVEDPANYRPIALLNTIYKLYAAILQKRLAAGLDEKLWETQYGFRKKRSTAQPLFITRRLQDLAESSGDKLFLVFLDWEKAFDKVDQEKLIEAMERVGTPEKAIRILKSFYINPRFRVKDTEGKSTYRRQRAGIRQGCPLSPYLFVCLMSVLFHDIHEDVDRKIDNHGLDHFNWWELIYADDTMLVGHRARELNILIKAIENASDKYNLKLNYGKCNYIAMNGKAHIHFSDGELMKRVDKAMYLGGEITTDAGRWSELNNRMNIALRTCNKLKTFWYKTDCTHKWKLHVYNAVIIAQISYGMNTVQLTQAMLNRLDAFQMRGLRYILKIEHAYYSGVSNQE